MKAKIEIRSDGYPRGTTVFVNGEDVECSYLKYEISADGIGRLTLEGPALGSSVFISMDAEKVRQ